MKPNKSIHLFEYGILQVGERGFESSHWKSLGWYNEKYGSKFFRLLPNGIKFNQYVGVIQIGNLTIEILPKIGRVSAKGDEKKWQAVLIDMLRECGWMKIHAHEKASLQFKPNSILEAYIEIFLVECEKLLREGLVKKYRVIAGNDLSLKGNILFAQQIQRNLIHQEQFYTRHIVFDRENLLNRILAKALRLIPRICQSSALKDRTYGLILDFPELKDINISNTTFQKLTYDRRTMRYKEAIEIAAMLLLNYRPDIISGRNDILAILFDMNDLWEEYISRQLSKSAESGWSVITQHQKSFWSVDGNNWSKGIRPDLVVTAPGKNPVIIDTKWKIPDDDIPSDVDLKQMFAYNEYWQAPHAILLYPVNDPKDGPKLIKGSFKERKGNSNQHKCSTMKVSILDEKGRLDRNIGKCILTLIDKKVYHA